MDADAFAIEIDDAWCEFIETQAHYLPRPVWLTSAGKLVWGSVLARYGPGDVVAVGTFTRAVTLQEFRDSARKARAVMTERLHGR